MLPLAGPRAAAPPGARLALGAQGQAPVQRPLRIVSLIPATTEMLFAMGAGDRVVAVGSYDHFPPEVERLPRVGALLDPNVERILSIKPDLVVLYGTQTELQTELSRAGIPFFSYALGSLTDIAVTIRSLGARVGAPGADAVADRIEQQIADIRTRVSGRSRPSTLLVFGREPGSLRNIDASAGTGFLHDMLLAAGGADALADIRRQSVMMSTEMVLARAPEVIIEVRSAGDAAAAPSDLRAWDTLAAVPAVKARRVYLLVGDEFVIPGPRAVLATERLARTLHPDAFR